MFTWGPRPIIPDEEINRIPIAIERAIRDADQGSPGAAYLHLSYGLERARAMQQEGKPWGDVLAQLWESECGIFQRFYGPSDV